MEGFGNVGSLRMGPWMSLSPASSLLPGCHDMNSLSFAKISMLLWTDVSEIMSQINFSFKLSSSNSLSQLCKVTNWGSQINERNLILKPFE